MSWTLHVPRGWTGVVDAAAITAATGVQVAAVDLAGDGSLDVVMDRELDEATRRRVLLWARFNDDEVLAGELERLWAAEDALTEQVAELAEWRKSLAAVKVAGITVLGVKA